MIGRGSYIAAMPVWRVFDLQHGSFGRMWIAEAVWIFLKMYLIVVEKRKRW